jgi:hypothetical protein
MKGHNKALHRTAIPLHSIGAGELRRWAANPRRSKMRSSQLKKSRLIVGIVLVVIAVLMFLFAKGDYSTSGAIGIGVLGLMSIAISRRR